MARLQPLWTAAASTDAAEITTFLRARGVTYERWPLPDAVRTVAAQPRLDDADKARLLAAFSAELAAKAAGQGYGSADVVAIRPDLPGVDDALARFDRVHFHDDDEVRAIVAGHGVFGFTDDDGRQFLLTVEAGDYISVPAGIWHWFYCGSDKFITALRLFRDSAGWVPRYRSTDRGVPQARA
ncbi:MAG: acireductone dioxygenase [Deltaproteobacteria bacterium HGW-Deltaproteobacteria-14]|jgi:1,2-dihydroxy-3-keto-5-methylthiopentene dioxygenase|nr:MAG: acireductone dioxygenase [Deltaproteobacteria bacterium HGW-Deltaproteobacteria-14]